MGKKEKKPPTTRVKPRATGPGHETVSEIHGLPLPRLFCELWNSGRWRQPSDDAINKVMPWLDVPIDFILSHRTLISASYGKLADIPQAKHFQEYRGSNSPDKPDLPWLDVDQHIMIAHNRHIGDDIGIALDYRSSTEDPRVVGSKWVSQGEKRSHHVEWIIVSNTFTVFTQLLGYGGITPS